MLIEIKGLAYSFMSDKWLCARAERNHRRLSEDLTHNERWNIIMDDLAVLRAIVGKYKHDVAFMNHVRQLTKDFIRKHQL